LQLANLLAGDPYFAKLADAGGDRIGHFVAGHDLIDHRARQVHGLASVGGQKHGATLSSDFAHRFQREIVTVYVKCVQISFLLLVSGFY
jgi:hypothetical protein